MALHSRNAHRGVERDRSQEKTKGEVTARRKLQRKVIILAKDCHNAAEMFLTKAPVLDMFSHLKERGFMFRSALFEKHTCYGLGLCGKIYYHPDKGASCFLA